MSMKELLAVLAGLSFGYFAVSRFFLHDKPHAIPRESNDSKATADESATLRNWHTILAVSESATKAEIDVAYKRAISKYHPDKVATMGDEIRAVAEIKSKQINEAYKLASRRFE